MSANLVGYFPLLLVNDVVCTGAVAQYKTGDCQLILGAKLVGSVQSFYSWSLASRRGQGGDNAVIPGCCSVVLFVVVIAARWTCEGDGRAALSPGLRPTLPRTGGQRASAWNKGIVPAVACAGRCVEPRQCPLKGVPCLASNFLSHPPTRRIVLPPPLTGGILRRFADLEA